MKPNPRACIAYIAGCLIANKKSSAVYDYSQSKYINIGGNLSQQRVNVYDYDQGCHLSGNGNNGNYSLYHYGDSHHISLEVKGRNGDTFQWESQWKINIILRLWGKLIF